MLDCVSALWSGLRAKIGEPVVLKPTLDSTYAEVLMTSHFFHSGQIAPICETCPVVGRVVLNRRALLDKKLTISS